MDVKEIEFLFLSSKKSQISQIHFRVSAGPLEALLQMLSASSGRPELQEASLVQSDNKTWQYVVSLDDPRWKTESASTCWDTEISGDNNSSANATDAVDIIVAVASVWQDLHD